ncbi:RNA-binding S4 domain-containing protein [uncultured Ferrovibrio sp.]|jgi:ribosome-associated heat shock protein Hsp15|uniref:RNA-binding S4 domain-containing protein n=1 Tax=uncultured Ferrovibrio sp. TaxID=1576913 RepID=UPI0026205294|nr:RNA-binding S4 domain-containing protein [uncultured Ferrovibrio sp.]
MGEVSSSQSSSQTALRLDKWLWMARFCKSRAIAQSFAEKGRIRINGRVIDKTHAQVRIGDVLTLPLPGGVRVVQITRLPLRRGPAPEAQATYVEIPPQRGEDDAATADRGGKD